MATSIEELKEFLTEDEIAAYEAEDEEAADAATSAVTDDEADADADPEDGEEGEATDPEEAEEGEPVKADPDPAPKPESEPTPDLTAIEEQLEAFRTERKAIMEEYENGDIDADEWISRIEALEKKADPVKVEYAQAQDAVQSSAKQWDQDCKAYFDQNPAFLADKDLLLAYDKIVRGITADPAFAKLTNAQVLEHAHKRLAFDADLLGLDNVPPPPGAQKQKKAKDDPAPKPKPAAKPKSDDLGDTPTTLATLPASDMSGTDDSPYAAMQRLVDTGTSDEIEAAFAKMTPEQREQFASADV